MNIDAVTYKEIEKTLRTMRFSESLIREVMNKLVDDFGLQKPKYKAQVTFEVDMKNLNIGEAWGPASWEIVLNSQTEFEFYKKWFDNVVVREVKPI